MVVAIAKMSPRLIAYERGQFAAQYVEEIARRPESPSECHEVCAHIVNACQRIPRRMVNGLIFKCLKSIPKLLQDRKIAVNNGIEQKSAKRIGPRSSDLGAAIAKVIPHGTKSIVRKSFAERQDVAITKKDPDRIGQDGIAFKACHACRN